jgi:16S rRNA (uracil1498-N3)-methyltransferase
VTAPVFLLPAPALDEVRDGDRVVLDGTEGRHAVSVVRLREGEEIVLVDGSGRRAKGNVTSTEGRDTVTIDVSGVSTDPVPQPTFTVVQALPKGERGELAVELLTEIGADVIVPWAAGNCIAQWKGDRVERGHRKWSDAALAAAKQSRRARFPQVAALHKTEQVAELLAGADLGLVLHESATESIAAVAPPAEGNVVLVIGPEGGLTADELRLFASAGARVVLIGPTVLRTSSAGIAAVAALLTKTSRWAAGARTEEVGG